MYPFFDRIRKPLKPMTRMCIGFLLASIGCVFAAVIQARIYATSPCGKYASKCKEHSTVSLWWQLAPIGIPAIGELFVNVTSYELVVHPFAPEDEGPGVRHRPLQLGHWRRNLHGLLGGPYRRE